LRERRGFISTVESMFACHGLVTAYRALEKPLYLDAIRKGYRGLVDHVGFRQVGDGMAINYYAHSTGLFPNINTIFVWLAAEVHQLTGEKEYLEYVPQILRFLKDNQKESGEFPYQYRLEPHFQCYQYNSYQFLTLTGYNVLAKDAMAQEILGRLAAYLSTGV